MASISVVGVVLHASLGADTARALLEVLKCLFDVVGGRALHFVV